MEINEELIEEDSYQIYNNYNFFLKWNFTAELIPTFPYFPPLPSCRCFRSVSADFETPRLSVSID